MKPEPIVLKQFHSPQTAIARFVFRRSWRSALIWGLVLGGYVASKVYGYVSAYPTAADRLKLASTLGSNVAFKALLGIPHQIQTTGGFTNWNTLNIMAMVAAIWGLLLATKLFRGEEETGRLEVMLSGITSSAGAALNTLFGLGLSLLLMYVVVSAIVVNVAHSPKIDFSLASSSFFILAAVSSAGVFMAVGAMASQIMPTRNRASMLAAGVFGICFMARVTGDAVNSGRWLLNFTPLGWIEKMQPLVGSRPIWLVPIAILVLVLVVATVHIAGRRDLGDSLIADKDSAPAHTALLNSPIPAALRLNRTFNTGWLLAAAVIGFIYGWLAKPANQVLKSESGKLNHQLAKVAHTGQFSDTLLFLGIVFFFIMVIIMVFAASSINNIRRDEASGYLDNMLVQPLSRQKWLWGRLLIVGLALLLAGLLGGLGTWAGVASQHSAVAIHLLLFAGISVVPPAMVVAGLAIFSFGFAPRLTAVTGYALIAWSFLIDLIGTGLKLNHWLLDTSLIHQTALAPTVNPDWKVATVLTALGIALAIIGSLRFNYRDLEAE